MEKHLCVKSMSLIVTVILSVFSFTGCIDYKTYKSEQFRYPISPDKTYVVLGEKIGKGNITNVAYGLHINGHAIAKGKGVRVVGTKLGCTPKGKNQIDFIVAPRNQMVYRIWEIDPKEIKPDGRALLFCCSLTSKKHCVIPRDNELIGLLVSWMGPVFFTKGDNDDLSFNGMAFELTKPGVYYLGNVTVTGELEKFDQDRYKKSLKSSASYQLMKSDLTLYALANGGEFVSSRVRAAKKHLESLGISTASFYDLSKKWANLRYEDLDDYKNADADIFYAKP